MIDIHTHILPGIDDGARTIEDSITMIREAKMAGFTDLFATSHYMDRAYLADTKKREQLINELEERLKREQIDIKLHIGAEIYVTPEMPAKISEGIVPTLKQGRYVLMELPMNDKLLHMENIILDLLSQRLVPIIAHPERYSYVQQDPNHLLPLLERGVLFQGNIGSAIGIYGKEAKKTLKLLLQHEMLQFLATDCHRPQSRYLKLSSELAEIKKIIPNSKIQELLTKNPSCMIEGKEIDMEDPIPCKKKLFGNWI